MGSVEYTDQAVMAVTDYSKPASMAAAGNALFGAAVLLAAVAAGGLFAQLRELLDSLSLLGMIYQYRLTPPELRLA